MKNKRIIAVAMATGMAVSLAACGGSASTTDTTGTADAATTEAADAATGEGTGFTFANYNAHEMKDAVERAVRVYRGQPEVWTALMRSAMTADFGFERSAEEYARLYIDIL